MKLTEKRIRQIIMEEIYGAMNQNDGGCDAGGCDEDFNTFVQEYFGEDPRRLDDTELQIMRKAFDKPEVRQNWLTLFSKPSVEESRRDKRLAKMQNKEPKNARSER